MALAKIHLPRLHSRAEEVYQNLRSDILASKLQPGERMVEAVIASKASVSRTPVREAIRKLEVEGLVCHTGEGLVVSGLTIAELADVCAVRETLEGMAARLAAGARSEMDLLTLERFAADYRDATKKRDVPQSVASNHAFHQKVWQMARNPFLEKQLASLRGTIERLQGTTLGRRSRTEESRQEHEALIDSLRAGDAERAERLARHHFQRAMAIRLSMLLRPPGS
jgi:DNA-binding GntR family transcriptional regulator